MTPPGWLASALGACWLVCPGCGPVDLSARFGPVEDGLAPEDSRWDWMTVIHHARDDCPVLGDAAARDDLGDALDRELSGHIVLAHYGEPAPLHTAVAAP